MITPLEARARAMTRAERIALLRRRGWAPAGRTQSWHRPGPDALLVYPLADAVRQALLDEAADRVRTVRT